MLSRTDEEIYRQHLASVLDFTGGAHILTKAQVMKLTGRGKDYVRDHILKKGTTEISAENLARYLMTV